ncbi:MAG: bifunctional hydroxymethylpyrimidine kinase/phosphomethylpyrimidine kinase [Thermodesulfobacteriota bacterium]
MNIVLTIAGSDPSGGAGIQVDIKVFSLLGVYGLSAITAQTIQDSKGVREILPTSEAFLSEEIKTLTNDFHIDAVKIGMLATKENLLMVINTLKLFPTREIVLDPVILSSSGYPLLEGEAIPLLRDRLLPEVKLVTPNIYEAGVLSGIDVKDMDSMREAAMIIKGFGARNIIVKGGDLKGNATDLFYDGDEFVQLKGQRLERGDIHGTGCVLSAAITAKLAKGLSLLDAVKEAKRFLNQRIKDVQRVGKGALFLV